LGGVEYGGTNLELAYEDFDVLPYLCGTSLLGGERTGARSETRNLKGREVMVVPLDGLY